MLDSVEELRKRWVEAVVDASEASGTVDGATKTTDTQSVKNMERESDFSDYDKPITVSDVEVLRSIGRKSINKFSSEDIKKAQKWAYKFYKELGTKSPFFRAWFGEWRAQDISKAEIVDTKADNRKDVVNLDTNWKIQTSKKVHKETSHHSGSAEVNAVKYLPYIDDITIKAVLFDSVISDKDNPNSLMFHTMYAYTEVMGYPALLKLQVEELFYHNSQESGELMRDYILQNIEEEPISKRNRLSRSNHLDKDSSTISISDLYEFVKTYDKDFSSAPEVSEAVLNDDGTPKVFYHGTNAEFTEFDLAKSGSNFGAVSEGMFFFTDKKEAYPGSAKDYARHIADTKGGKEQIYECYIKMQNPLIVDSKNSYDPISHYDKNAAKIYDRYFEGDYDGIIIKDSTGKNSSSTLALVDNATQIKSSTDNIGTFDSTNKDIRFSEREDIDNEESLGYTKQKNQKGENIYNENGNNAEVLEQGEVSTSNRGRDGLWKQGQDPEEVYKRLANSQNDKGGVRATRSGSSGWLGNRRGDKSYVLRLGKGLLRDLRGRQLSGVDTAGRILSEDVNKKFADTVLKTNNGELLSLYHWTDARFTKFKKGDIGFHFGTLNTAYNRYKDIIDKRRTGESFYKESYVNIKNPVMINFDPMSWTVFPTAYKLNEQGIISNKDIAELEKLDGYTHTKYDSPASIELRRILTHKGYDGIIYSNGIEGDLSVIAFNDDQIYTVAENGIDIASRSNVSDETKFKYSDRDSDSFSDRSLLANALESVAQNDVERQKIAEYRANIANYEAQQKKLSELKRQIKEMSFAKGPRDKDAITNLRIEATKTENRINIYDKRLLNLEATKALKDVLTREKAKAYKRAEDKGKELLRAQREKAEAKLTATVEKYQESRRISTEGRRKTEERHKIFRVVQRKYYHY